MKLFAFVFFLFAALGSAQAQTIHDIEAGGGPNGPTPYYAPQFITIQVGDIVRWTNSGGTHNVDGTLDAYPDNPVGFTSGNPSNSLWVFEFTFDTPGVYGFECSAFDHADTQFGTITVTAVGLPEINLLNVRCYPNPTSSQLQISIDQRIDAIRIYNQEMGLIENAKADINETKALIDVSRLASGVYILEVQSDDVSSYSRFTRK